MFLLIPSYPLISSSMCTKRQDAFQILNRTTKRSLCKRFLLLIKMRTTSLPLHIQTFFGFWSVFEFIFKQIFKILIIVTVTLITRITQCYSANPLLKCQWYWFSKWGAKIMLILIFMFLISPKLKWFYSTLKRQTHETVQTMVILVYSMLFLFLTSLLSYTNLLRYLLTIWYWYQYTVKYFCKLLCSYFHCNIFQVTNIS